MSNGSICTPEEKALFHSTRGTNIVCLTRGESIGLALVAESGFLSLVAVLGVFALIFVSISGFPRYPNSRCCCYIAQCLSERQAHSVSGGYLYGEPTLSSCYKYKVIKQIVAFPVCI
jgi:hypothetical protein